MVFGFEEDKLQIIINMKIKLQYLATGTGRCGTNYIARFLTHAGIMCGHEAIFDYHGLIHALRRLQGNMPIFTSDCSQRDSLRGRSIQKWFDPEKIKAECSYLAAPFLNEEFLSGVKLIHVIRNPLETLSSFVLDVNFLNDKQMDQLPWRTFVLNHMPEIKEEKSIIEKTCRYIMGWNKMIEKSNLEKIKVRIEEYPYTNMLNFLNIKKDQDLLPNKKINSWKRRNRNLSLEEIPSGKTRDEFVNFMKENGYSYITL